MASIRLYSISNPPVPIAGTNQTGTISNLGPGRVWVGDQNIQVGQGWLLFPGDELEYSHTVDQIWAVAFTQTPPSASVVLEAYPLPVLVQVVFS